MKIRPSVLALVPDAFGGRGGIAQYTRDFLVALADTGAVRSITVLPRNAPEPVTPPHTIQQIPARHGRFTYSVVAGLVALGRPVDVVFCGHPYTGTTGGHHCKT